MQRKGVVTKSQKRNASKLKVGIAVAQFNADITNALLKGALTILRERNVRDDHIYVVHTYGSFELPHAAGRLIKKYEVDAVVALGCIIKGETKHDEYIAHAVASGLMRIALDTGIPVGFGVLTTNNLAQARKRSRGQTNHGAAAAIAAIDAA
ncbi:MAG TPA: 6,7-dimethyl-8-ribityllumazine synthase [Candidatus Paceibacterota bacterium]